MTRVGIGLVGCGLFGESHLRAVRGIPNAEVRAVFDTDRDRAERIAAEFQVPRVCGDLDELCGLPDVDLVDVVTPESGHAAPVLSALARGKHAFVEKPMATDLADCARMIEAARAAGRILMVGHILRFEAKYAMLKEEVASGRLGDVVSMHSRRNRPKEALPLYGRVHPMLETGIHDLDMMLWYADRPVRRARGFARSVTGSKHPDTFWGVLEFEGGAIGVIETIWLLPSAGGVALDDAFRVVGSRGIGDLRLTPGALSFWREDGHEIPDVSYEPRVLGATRGALRDELSYLCDCVVAGRTPEVNSGIEGSRAVRVALALIESAATGADVVIEDWA
ncbi:Gfo/Idh/MocA family oxidoreductase [Paludisphaera sp.]|uniref:Gfo/Idh/MocA family protein n=1 Tax=Paludisphaera sp. TaxID=2017432 RepID=UPI00301D8D6F